MNPKGKGYCTAKRRYFADFLGMSDKGVRVAINRCVDMGRIEKVGKDNLVFSEKYYNEFVVNTPAQSAEPEEAKEEVDRKKVPDTSAQSTASTIYNNNNNNNNPQPEDEGGVIKQNRLKLIRRFVQEQSCRSQVSAQIKKDGIDNYIDKQYQCREKLIRMGVSDREIQGVLQFILHDEFWKGNIMSIAKLDKKSEKTDTKYIYMMLDAQKRANLKQISGDPIEQYIMGLHDHVKKQRMIAIYKDRNSRGFTTESVVKLERIYNDMY